MNPITAQHLTELEAVLSNAMNLVGASDDLAIVVLNDIYYAVNRRYLDMLLDQFHHEGTNQLLAYSYFAFRRKGDTLVMLKSRIPFNLIQIRLARHRYNVVQDEGETVVV